MNIVIIFTAELKEIVFVPDACPLTDASSQGPWLVCTLENSTVFLSAPELGLLVPSKAKSLELERVSVSEKWLVHQMASRTA